MTPLRRSLLPLVVASLLLLQLGSPAPAAETAAPSRAHRVSTPVLVERAVEAGRISRATGYLYTVYAMTSPDRVPAAFRSDVPFHGTALLLEVRRALPTLRQSPAKAALKRALSVHRAQAAEGPGGPGQPGAFCDALSTAPMPNTYISPHFYIEYNAVALGGGLTIDDYVDSLEASWDKEIEQFGWARVPVYTPNPAPENKYHVRIDTLAPVLYGYVSNFGTHAGSVGNNPNTPWNDVDADASCMGLNADYDPFPGTPQQALDATTAHEFNHSIQFGYGALSGANSPDPNFVEGGATWMEDEVFDGSNDNYNYLWPAFADDMWVHGGDEYSYWITWRGLTERYGAGIAGGGEDLMQEFWELISKNAATNSIIAMNAAVQSQGTTLPAAYHAYAIAVKFNNACGANYSYPHCFEEGPAYEAHGGNGEPPVHATIAAVGGSTSRNIPDNYSLNWIGLPTGTQNYSVTLTNTSAGGQFRGSAVCDTGSGFNILSLGVVGGGQSGVATLAPTGCAKVVLVVTNQTETAPATSANRGFTVTTAAAAAATCPNARGTTGTHRVGTAGDDVLTGSDGVDVICGLGGNDTLQGLGSKDLLIGGLGNDDLTGGAGNDILRGDAGNDALSGGIGGDSLTGHKGADVHVGGDGKDDLRAKDGVQGNDSADGGPAVDACQADPNDTVINCP